MHVFGLTGGIASGKSTVSRMFRDRGLAVVDADVLAREVVAKGTEGLREVVAKLGDVLLPDGSLDRKKVAAIVFSDETKRKLLNSILHPRIATLGAERLAAIATRGEPVACYEAALLVENRLADMFRPLVVVSAPEHVQIARILARDGGTDEEARGRIRAQTPLDEKVRAADIVISNDGSEDELHARADDALDQVLERVGVDKARYPRAAKA